MKKFKRYSKAFLLLLVAMMTLVATSCSDDETEGWDGTYGYVQFKLSKKVRELFVLLPLTNLRNWMMPNQGGHGAQRYNCLSDTGAQFL